MKDDMPFRIAVTGITGRMGKEIVRCIIQKQEKQINKEIVLGAAISYTRPDICGMDIGIFMQSSQIGITIANDIESVKENFDILIDFTTPESSMKYLQFCVLNNKNMVIGTTGLNKDHQCLIKYASKKIGIVCSANFSIGITIMLKLLEKVSQTMDHFRDVDIIEMHHNKKNDIPSGTSLMMNDVIKKNRSKSDFSKKDLSYNNKIICDSNLEESRTILKSINRDIPIHSIRSGNIIGEHSALFMNSEECLDITHKAFSRIAFVDGVLRSSIWLGNSKVGLFDLNDVLGLDI